MRDLRKSFSIDYFSEADDRRYMGTFTVKKLTIGDLSRLGQRKAQLCGGLSYDPESGKGVDAATAMLNEMIAHCEISLITRPEWFNSDEITDVGLLNAVYEEVAAFESNFLRAKSPIEGERGVGGREVASSAEPSGERGSTNTIEDVVDKKIPKISPLA